MPAQLTSAATAPKRAASVSTAFSSVTSRRANSRCAGHSPSWSSPQHTTRYPVAASLSAQARPMPEPPPVTMATLSILSFTALGRRPLERLDFRQRLLDRVERIQRRRTAAVEERVQAELLQLRARHAVSHCAAQMHLDLARAVECDALRERDQAALAQRERRAVPDLAPRAFGRPLLER